MSFLKKNKDTIVGAIKDKYIMESRESKTKVGYTAIYIYIYYTNN